MPSPPEQDVLTAGYYLASLQLLPHIPPLSLSQSVIFTLVANDPPLTPEVTSVQWHPPCGGLGGAARRALHAIIPWYQVYCFRINVINNRLPHPFWDTECSIIMGKLSTCLDKLHMFAYISGLDVYIPWCDTCYHMTFTLEHVRGVHVTWLIPAPGYAGVELSSGARLSVPCLATLLSLLLAEERQAAISQLLTWYHVTRAPPCDWLEAVRLIYSARSHSPVLWGTWAFLPCWLNSRNYHSK